jgi:hypothetical protein
MNDRKHFQSRITTTQRAEVGHAKRLGIGLARVALIFLLVAEGAEVARLLSATFLPTPTATPVSPPQSESPVGQTNSPTLPEPVASRPNPSDSMVLARLRRPGSGLTPSEAEELAQVIIEESARHKFEPALVMAVIHVESSGRILAVSPVGALGLMQIMPPTGRELAARHGIPWNGPDTLLDPVVNVKLGVAYLRRLTDRYQDVNVALAAYNWGPGRIDRRLRAGESLPTLYPDRVMQVYTSTQRETTVGRS